MIETDVEDMTDQAAGPSATATDKNPKGGLSAAGRKKFGVKAGVKSYSSASDADKKRWVRWALRFTKTPRPLVGSDGKPTRYALMFNAWGEAVPKTAAAVRAVHAKAVTRAKSLKMGQYSDKAEIEQVEGVDCDECDRQFVTDEALLTHLDVHLEAVQTEWDDEDEQAREFSGGERKKAASSGAALKDGSFPIKTVADLKNAIAAYGRAKDKAKAKAHIIARAKALGATKLLPEGWAGSDKAELMHSCQPCDRPFAGERSLFQHATAVHGYDERTDRANAGGVTGAPDFVLGQSPWEANGRRLVILVGDDGVSRVLHDYETLYKTGDSASHQSNHHGSSSAVAALSCGSCERAFLTVRGLKDHAEAVHDSALDATFNERQQLVGDALKSTLNNDPLRGRIWSYVLDMTDAQAIFETDSGLFQVDYSIADDGIVTLGTPQQVRRRTVYEPVGSQS